MSGGASKVGMALDGTSACCVWLESGLWHSDTIDCDGSPAAIETAFDVLLKHTASSAEVTVTLCRPLLQSRTIAVPGVSKNSVERILSRDWPRHIVPARIVPHAVAATAISKGKWYAQFAPADTLEAIVRAAEENGSPVSVRSIDDAICSALRPVSSVNGRSTLTCGVVSAAGRSVHAVLVKDGGVIAARKFARNVSVDDIEKFAHGGQSGSKPVVILWGDLTSCTQTALELVAKGLEARVGAQPFAWNKVDPQSVLLEARKAAEEAISKRTSHSRVKIRGSQLADTTNAPSALEWIAHVGIHASPAIALLAPSVLAGRRARMRVLAWQLAGAVVAAGVIGFALLKADVQHQLAAIATQRADISARVQQGLQVRTQLEDAVDASRSLAMHEANASRTNTIIAQIARTLPRTSALQSLTIAGDSLTIEGESPRSADVYSALRQVSVLDRVRLASPLRQERRGADTVVERFSFNAMVRSAAPGRLASK